MHSDTRKQRFHAQYYTRNKPTTFNIQLPGQPHIVTPSMHNPSALSKNVSLHTFRDQKTFDLHVYELSVNMIAAFGDQPEQDTCSIQ